MVFFAARQNNGLPIYHARHYSFYLLIAVVCLLLGITNANEDANNDGQGITDKLRDFKNAVLETFRSESHHDNSSTANETLNETKIPFFYQPMDIDEARGLFVAFLKLLAQLFIIFGGVIPYIPQYMVIKRTRNAEGFSNYVCLTLLVANIIRIEFWFGKRFETPLLLQSIIMIICMLVMLELWTRVHAETVRRLAASDPENIVASSREQLTDQVLDKRFTDFEVSYFWRWTKFSSYLQFLFIFTIICSIISWFFCHNQVYIESIGLLAVFCEALLGVPQFVRNLRLRSTEGMSVKMVLFWAAGDIFKTVYFIARKAPLQFLICGVLQISIDLAILIQVIVFSNKCRSHK